MPASATNCFRSAFEPERAPICAGVYGRKQARGGRDRRRDRRRSRRTVEQVEPRRHVLMGKRVVRISSGRRGPEDPVPGLAAQEEHRIGTEAAGKQVPGRVRLGRRSVAGVRLPVPLGQGAAAGAVHDHVDRLRVGRERLQGIPVEHLDRVHHVEGVAAPGRDVAAVRERRRLVQVGAVEEQVVRECPGRRIAVGDISASALGKRVEAFLTVPCNHDLEVDRDRLVQRQIQRVDRNPRIAMQVGCLVHRPRAGRMQHITLRDRGSSADHERCQCCQRSKQKNLFPHLSPFPSGLAAYRADRSIDRERVSTRRRWNPRLARPRRRDTIQRDPRRPARQLAERLGLQAAGPAHSPRSARSGPRIRWLSPNSCQR